jgi:hypothetical protein
MKSYALIQKKDVVFGCAHDTEAYSQDHAHFFGEKASVISECAYASPLPKAEIEAKLVAAGFEQGGRAKIILDYMKEAGSLKPKQYSMWFQGKYEDGTPIENG